MNIKVIIPYFGNFPNYMNLFLESCNKNQKFEFIFITDQKKTINCPKNVVFIHQSFKQVQELFCEKLGSKAILYSPYKLCDYRPAYGYVFSEYIGEADFWGHCDLDMVFGKIINFFDENVFQQYEKIQTQGHFILYKNTERMNEMFRKKIKYGIMFDEMVKYKEPCFFDEIMFPEICKANNVKLYKCKQFADILPQYPDFTLSSMHSELINRANQIFYWENGSLYREYDDTVEELLYIHLQKRPLNTYYSGFDERIYFTPQGIYSKKNYTNECEYPNDEQVRSYKIKRWQSLNVNKLKIKLKILSLRLRKTKPQKG